MVPFLRVGHICIKYVRLLQLNEVLHNILVNEISTSLQHLEHGHFGGDLMPIIDRTNSSSITSSSLEDIMKASRSVGGTQT